MSIARKIGNLGIALDSAALSTFLSKGTTDGEFDTIAWGDVTGKPSYIDSSLATQLFDSAYVQLRQSAVSSGGLDSAAVVSLIDSNYVAARASAASSSGFIMYNYNATSGQTAFQDSDTAGNVLSYTADGILVYYNGLLLADEDYTATDGSAVTLTEGADSGAQITIGKWNLTGSGSSSGGGSSGGWYGDRGIIFGGQDTTNQPGTYINTIQYFDITTTGNASDFGDLSTTAGFNAGLSDTTYGVSTIGWTGSATSQAIDYITISTTSNASSFGSLSGLAPDTSGACDGTVGLWLGGYSDIWNSTNIIESITVATPSNSSDFGDLLAVNIAPASVSDGTYAHTCGGYIGNYTNVIQYVAFSTPGNSSDFGDLVDIYNRNSAAVGDNTYGVVAGGQSPAQNRIDYFTMGTPGNASDFGDLLQTQYNMGGTGNGTYGVFGHGVGGTTPNGNTMSYITIATPGNAADFGDMTTNLAYANGWVSGSPS